MVYLGIDGGGSKTAFILQADDKEPVRFETGPSNWISTGKEETRRNIAQGVQRLRTLPDVVCGGFAGAGRPEGIRFYTDCLMDMLPKARVIVETDAFISYIGAIGPEPGVLLIAGTGSIAVGRCSDGSMIRAGGWGPMFSDEGGGFWIGREAVCCALRANDSGDIHLNEFITSVCNKLELDSIQDVSGAWTSGALAVSQVASLAELLLRQYPAEPAKGILRAASAHLHSLAQVAIARVGIPNCRRSIAGSIGSHPVIQHLILQQEDGLEFDAPAHSAAQGALIWARSRVRG